MRPLRIALSASAVLASWVFIDLYLRVDLPGASDLKFAVFRVAGASVAWLGEGAGTRPAWVAGVLVVIAVAGLVSGARGAPLRQAGGLLLGGVELVVVVLAALMERGLFAGLVIGMVVWLRWGGGRNRVPGRRGGLLAVLLGGLAAAAAAVYLVEIFKTRSEGYGLLEALGAAARSGAPLTEVALGAALVLLLAGLFVHRRSSWVVLPAAASAVLAGLALEGAPPVLSLALSSAALLLLLMSLWAPLVSYQPERSWDPATWPRRAVPFVLIAVLAIGHSYVFRVFACPVEHPALTRVAAPSEVFRIALGQGAEHAVLTLRTDRRLGRLPLQPAPGELKYASPGPIPQHGPDFHEPVGKTLATLEELLYAPDVDRFYGTLLGGHHDFYALEDSPDRSMEMFLFSMPGHGRGVDLLRGFPEQCWIGSMVWSAERDRLYIGCEYEASVQRYGPLEDRFETEADDPVIGDVAAMALDEVGSRLFTTSFWKGQVVTEIDPDSMEVRRSRRVGGANVDLAFDPASQRVFVTGYYDSRVRVLAASDLEIQSPIRTGFGTRAVSVDAQRDLVLASSVYDGLLRVCEASTGARVETLAVGGHVKDIAIDSERGLAWLWSQCGLFRLDLKQLRD